MVPNLGAGIFTLTGHGLRVDNILDTEYKRTHPTIQVLARPTSIHPYIQIAKQTDGISGASPWY
jgi:hypothetical protein